MVAVSVIIPVYNVEKYLRQCLDSVINQTLEDIEIICVDDCSTDDSFEILKEYASKDSRIVLLKQKVNQGQGVARNLALEIANGDYIMFCDPDDWYELNTCEIAFNEISKNRTDMALFFYNRYFEEDKKYFPDNARYQRYSRIVEQKIDINTNKNFSIVDFFIVNQIYSRHFINQYKIRFDSCRMFEDQHFMGMAYIYANKIYIINAFLYNYRIRNNSTTFTCQYAYKDLFRISHYLISLLLDVKDSKIFIATFLSYRLRTILWWWGFYSKYGKAIQRDFYSRFKEFLIYIFSKLDIDSYKEEIGTYYYKQIESIIKLNFYQYKFKSLIQNFVKNIFTISNDFYGNKYLILFEQKIQISSLFRYKILGVLFAWIFPNRGDRNKFRTLCEKIDNRSMLSILPNLFESHIKKLQHSNKKIRVLFLINEVSKWKTQSLYDLLLKTDKFEPLIALTIADWQNSLSLEEKKQIINENYDYFNNKNFKTVIAYDINKNKAIDLKIFKPQIVFFQQPWGIAKKQSPQKVARYALTCYIPYYVPNYGILSMDYRDFHKYLYRYYVPNFAWEQFYKQRLGTRCRNIYGLGHTGLDMFYLNKNNINSKHYIIYAPHWSIFHSKNINREYYSTFDWNGKFILEYAEAHPNVNWVFKPHPTLKSTLLKIGEMSLEEIDDYYNRWEQIATVCYDSDYIDLFMQSDAMITDCGSFLMEYFCTGKPLIHLLSRYNLTNIPRHIQPIFDSFYSARNIEELELLLNEIITNKQDFKAQFRQNLLNNFNFKNKYAAKNILEDLELSIKGELK